MAHAFPRFEAKLKTTHTAEVAQGTLAAYAGRVPDELLTWWRESGFCSYGDGLLCTVNPDDFADVDLPLLAEGESAIVFMRSALGCLVTWNGAEAHIHDLARGEKTDLYDSLPDAIDTFFIRDSYLDAIFDRDVFREALPRLGPPGPDECYGYLPPKALGGSGAPETLHRVKLREHLALLAQL